MFKSIEISTFERVKSNVTTISDSLHNKTLVYPSKCSVNIPYVRRKTKNEKKKLSGGKKRATNVRGRLTIAIAAPPRSETRTKQILARYFHLDNAASTYRSLSLPSRGRSSFGARTALDRAKVESVPAARKISFVPLGNRNVTKRAVTATLPDSRSVMTFHTRTNQEFRGKRVRAYVRAAPAALILVRKTIVTRERRK